MVAGAILREFNGPEMSFKFQVPGFKFAMARSKPNAKLET